jgi:hypothetical protein
MQVKIFNFYRTDFKETEFEINKWLYYQHINILFVNQSESDHFITISIFFD